MDPALLVPFSETVRAWYLQLNAGGKQSTPSNYDVEEVPLGSISALPANLPQRGRTTEVKRKKGWSEKIQLRYAASDRKKPTDEDGNVVKKATKKPVGGRGKKKKKKKKKQERRVGGRGLASSTSGGSTGGKRKAVDRYDNSEQQSAPKRSARIKQQQKPLDLEL